MLFNSEKMLCLFNKLIRMLYPERCPVCDAIIPLTEDYCKCSAEISEKINDEYCRHCGQNAEDCSCFSENAFYLPDIVGVYYYGGRVRADILNLKFNNSKRLAVKLGTDMAIRCATAYSDIDFDIVSFMPMSKRAYNIRGYNQSELLARQISKQLFVSCQPLFEKIKDTSAQHELSAGERAVNLYDSVKLRNGVSVEGKNILLCDDVKTTGATLFQCVDILEKAGALRVCCVCAAVTKYKA